jgi:hypothetical protein
VIESSGSSNESHSGCGRALAYSALAAKTSDVLDRSPTVIVSPGFTKAQDVDNPSVHAEVAVGHELTLAHGSSRSSSDRRRCRGGVRGVGGTSYRFAQDARGFAKVVLELRFEHAVIAAHLLLLAQLTAVFRYLLTARLTLGLLAGRGAPTLDGALFEAAIAFEEQFDLLAGLAGRGFATAETADGPV